jgi:prepilin peptidase CpaA
MRVPSIVLLVGFVAACMVVDMRTRRIPNVLTFPAILLALVLNAGERGAPGLLSSLAGAGLAMCVLVTPFALGGIGGGDVKMMGAVGALLGPRLALASLATGMVLGGVVMIAHLARRGRLREKLVRTTAMLSDAARAQSFEPLRLEASDPDAVSLPYSVPLGLGSLAVLVLAGGS